MNNRMFEVILIVSILFIVWYFLLYHFYFDIHCSKTDGLLWKDKHTTMVLMWQCKDSHICSVDNINSDTLNRDVTSWECNKVIVNYFEPSFYKQKLNNLIK